MILIEGVPNEMPRKPKMSEVNLKDVKLIEQLSCQLIESYQQKTKVLSCRMILLSRMTLNNTVNATLSMRR